MSKPTQDISWATNATYAAGSEAGNATKVEPASGRKADGFSPETKPLPQEFNWLLNALVAYVLWMVDVVTINRVRAPTPFGLSGNCALGSFGAPTNVNVGYFSNGAAPTGGFLLDLDVPEGYKLSSFTASVYGPSANGFVLTLLKQKSDGTTLETLATMTLAGGGTTSWATPTTFNLLAASDEQSFTAAAGGIYTRTTGDFVADGFFVGQPVQWSGFSNSSNNVAGTITAVSSLSMTISTTGQTAETSATASCSNTMPAIDGTWIMNLEVAGTGSTADTTALSYLRYSMMPQ